jgi:uncharacterized protein YbjQ (UPF0145 family)
MLICNTPITERQKIIGLVQGVSCEVLKYGKDKNDYQELTEKIINASTEKMKNIAKEKYKADAIFNYKIQLSEISRSKGVLCAIATGTAVYYRRQFMNKKGHKGYVNKRNKFAVKKQTTNLRN